METKVLTTHVPLPLAEQIDELAARLDRSRGWIVKQALISWVAQQGASGFAEVQQSFDHQISRSPAEATEALIALRQTTTLGDIPWQELRDTRRR